MKKVTTCITVFAILFLLNSCGMIGSISKIKEAAESVGDVVSDAIVETADVQSDETEVAVDFNSIYSGNGSSDQVLGQLSEEEKQQIIAQGKLAGIEVIFGNDGSTTMIYEDGSKLVQSANGTWVVSNSEGEVGQIGGSWPDNEFTQMLPAPELGELSIAVTETDTFTASFSGTDTDQIKIFVEKAIEMGFNVEPQTNEITGDGAVYSYTAQNADGWCFTATSSNGQHIISLTKPAS